MSVLIATIPERLVGSGRSRTVHERPNPSALKIENLETGGGLLARIPKDRP